MHSTYSHKQLYICISLWSLATIIFYNIASSTQPHTHTRARMLNSSRTHTFVARTRNSLSKLLATPLPPLTVISRNGTHTIRFQLISCIAHDASKTEGARCVILFWFKTSRRIFDNNWNRNFSPFFLSASTWLDMDYFPLRRRSILCLFMQLYLLAASHRNIYVVKCSNILLTAIGRIASELISKRRLCVYMKRRNEVNAHQHQFHTQQNQRP